jgi:hypothetical protein
VRAQHNSAATTRENNGTTRVAANKNKMNAKAAKHALWVKFGEDLAKPTGASTARGLFVAFLPSRPLKWGFRTCFRRNIPAFRP